MIQAVGTCSTLLGTRKCFCRISQNFTSPSQREAEAGSNDYAFTNNNHQLARSKIPSSEDFLRSKLKARSISFLVNVYHQNMYGMESKLFTARPQIIHIYTNTFTRSIYICREVTIAVTLIIPFRMQISKNGRHLSVVE